MTPQQCRLRLDEWARCEVCVTYAIRFESAARLAFEQQREFTHRASKSLKRERRTELQIRWLEYRGATRMRVDAQEAADKAREEYRAGLVVLAQQLGERLPDAFEKLPDAAKLL